MWALALLHKEAGALTRVHPMVVTPPHEVLCVTSDASPWGIGAVLTQDGQPIAWLADSIHRFEATLGDSAFTTTWESLAILVALRVWRQQFPGNTRFAIRSDSLGALSRRSQKYYLRFPNPSLAVGSEGGGSPITAI